MNAPLAYEGCQDKLCSMLPMLRHDPGLTKPFDGAGVGLMADCPLAWQ